MASVFKATPGAKKYTITWRDENGRRRKKTGATDKGVSQRIANELENRVALRREGLIDTKDEAYRDHEAKPLVEHLRDYEAALVGNGGSKKYPTMTTHRIERVLGLAKVKRISELSLSKAMSAIASLRAGEDMGAETVNHHIRAVKGFARWLWRDGRAREHYLAHLATSSAAADLRHVRRALTPEEAARVVQAAASGPDAFMQTGPDRAVLYHLALGTGFRAEELRTLTPERFNLESDPPTVTARACYTKNGKEAVQPLARSLADRLRPWLALRPPGRPLFGKLTVRTAEMLRVDLEAAGIPYETDSGVVDFHSLRGCYISNLVSSGASVKTCQTLARHSSPSLTIGIYAKASLHDISGAVEALPDLTPSEPVREVLAATGTDGGATNPSGATDPLVVLTQDDAQQEVYAIRAEESDSAEGRDTHPTSGEGSAIRDHGIRLCKSSPTHEAASWRRQASCPARTLSAPTINHP
ncbi:MAG: tyrosine-type recombinase/integrase [Isosphaerales bacterium]